VSRYSIRLADLTKVEFRRAQAHKRLPPSLSTDNLSIDQAAGLALWSVIVRRVPLSARASRTVFSMCERRAGAVLAEPSAWCFCAVWLDDEPEPGCDFCRYSPQGIATEAGDGLQGITVIHLNDVAIDLLDRLGAPGHGEPRDVAA
jgi:hypothetical protein